MKFLLSPDPAAGGDPVPDPQPAPTPTPTAAPAQPGPAARAVLEGGKTERELQLEEELNGERSSHARTAAEKKEREQKIAELEDQLSQLRAEPPKPKKVRAFNLNFGD